MFLEKILKKFIFLSVFFLFFIPSVYSEEGVAVENKSAEQDFSDVEWITMPVEVPVKRYSNSTVVIPPLFKERLRQAIEQEMRDSRVEIFVKGEQYQSIKEYKKNMDSLKEAIPVEENKASLGYNLKGLSEEDLDKLSKEELKGIIQSLSQEKKVLNKEGLEDSEIQELQGMMDAYAKDHKELQPITIDPKKVKTIMIGVSPLEEKKVTDSTQKP